MRWPARTKATFDAGVDLPWAEFDAVLRPALEAQIEDAVAGAIAAALARGLQITPDVIAAAIAQIAPGYADAWVAAVMATTQDRIAAAVERYTAGEISLDELFASVDSLFSEGRADLIATTETTRLYDAIGQVINHDAGVEMVRFLTVRDQFVCPICEALDNEVFTVDEAPNPPEDTHDMCRCFLAAEVPEAQSGDSVAA